jgi:hypothetical protein
LQGAAVLPALQKKLLSGGGTTRHWPADAKIIEKAISRPVFTELKTPALRMIRERLELDLRTKKTEDTEIPSVLQIEHVLPQKWAAHWPLKGKVIRFDINQGAARQVSLKLSSQLLKLADEVLQ